jgi:AraC-like DNA-binding protein
MRSRGTPMTWWWRPLAVTIVVSYPGGEDVVIVGSEIDGVRMPLRVPTAPAERWELSGPSVALDEWAGVLATTHVAFETEPTERTPRVFKALVTRRAVGDLMLVDCDTFPFVGHRRRVDDASSELVGLQIVRRGSEAVSTNGHRHVSSPGDVKVWVGWEPVDIDVLEPFAKRTLIFPLRRVLDVCPSLSTANVMPTLRGDGATGLLVRYVNALAMELPQLDGTSSGIAAEVALDLLRAALEPSVPASRVARKLALRSEVRRFVRAHLQDWTMTPESIARAHAISVRVLHATFEGSGESVAALIRRERLARCRADLERPNGGSVTEVAFRWGFTDPAHFSRVFKREFAITPRELRIATRTGAGKPDG